MTSASGLVEGALGDQARCSAKGFYESGGLLDETGRSDVPLPCGLSDIYD
jgi:hypothetical protein